MTLRLEYKEVFHFVILSHEAFFKWFGILLHPQWNCLNYTRAQYLLPSGACQRNNEITLFKTTHVLQVLPCSYFSISQFSASVCEISMMAALLMCFPFGLCKTRFHFAQPICQASVYYWTEMK